VYEGAERIGYDIETLSPRKRIPLCRVQAIPRGVSIGHFTFSSEAIDLGHRALAEGGGQKVTAYFVDEVGPLEMKGQGWAPALRTRLKDPATMIVLAVRPDLVDAVQENFGFTARRVWSVAGGSVDKREIVDTLIFNGSSASPRP
jgi:nucleoside-triphosphatase THEP1